MASDSVNEQSKCHEEIITALTALDTLSHEETRVTLTESRTSEKAQYRVASSKRAVVVRVAPDRSFVTLWKNGVLRLESIAIGNRTWNREPGEEWKLQSNSLAVESTTRIAESRIQLAAQVKKRNASARRYLMGKEYPAMPMSLQLHPFSSK
jgi:hypothetical protein